MPTLLSAKTVLRCRDFVASRDFYQAVLGLAIVEEWEEPQGRGAVFGIGGDGSPALFEIYQMTQADPRYDPAFAEQLTNDKIDLQLRSDSVDAWVQRLVGRWPFTAPEQTPWGHRWIKLRDPDGLLIAIYEQGAAT